MKKVRLRFSLLIGLLIILFLAPQIQAATIYGNIYGPGLDLLEKAIVEVDSIPKQNMVAADGSYSFNLTPGNYTIEVFYSYNGILLYAKENVNIPTGGDYVNDIILFSVEDIGELELDESDLALIEDLLSERKTNYGIIILIISIAIILLAVFIVYFLLKYKKIKRVKQKKRKKGKGKKKPTITKIEKFTGDELFNQVKAFIKKERRVTQKDLRNKFNVSETKISLIITDLEDRGEVKKIKKGRGNIIIYK